MERKDAPQAAATHRFDMAPYPLASYPLGIHLRLVGLPGVRSACYTIGRTTSHTAELSTILSAALLAEPYRLNDYQVRCYRRSRAQ